MKATSMEMLAPWLHAHSGVVPIEKLVEFGCSERAAYRLATGPDFDLVMPGILKSTHWPLGRAQLMVAACARNRQVTVGRTTAAAEWRFRGVPKDDDVYVMVPHATRIVLPGVIVHRTRQLDRVDVVTRDDGVRLTSPSRTLFDCADLFGPTRTASILEQLIDQQMGSFITHAETVTRLAQARRPGSRTMSTVIASRPAWRRAMQSELEVLVLAEIARQRLPTPVTQMWYILSNGARIRMDFAWPEHKVNLEVDHPFWHAGADESRRDKQRDLLLGAAGWYTGRVTDLDVRGPLAASIAQIGAVLAQR